MAEQRVVRSKEERKAEIEKKIQFHKDCIKTLEQKIHDIDNPKRILTEGKLTDDEAAKALGFKDANEMRAKLLAAAEAKNK